MPGIITVNVDLPADNADVLAGTLLDTIPGPGYIKIYVASTQRDGILSIVGSGVVGGAFRIPPPLRANGMPDLLADMPTMVGVTGGKALIAYDEVTAADAFATIIFEPAS